MGLGVAWRRARDATALHLAGQHRPARVEIARVFARYWRDPLAAVQVLSDAQAGLGSAHAHDEARRARAGSEAA